jgi:hypothetical protein
MTTTNRAPLFVLASLGVSITVLALFATAMEAGVGMMILLVICAGVIGALLLGLFRGFVTTWLKMLMERNRHVEAVLEMGYDPKSYIPVPQQTLQIAAPVQQTAAPVDPRRDKALRLLNETIESDIKDKDGSLKYGPKSGRIMTQEDAGGVGIIANDWSAAVAYLFAFGVATGNSGTIILDKRNVSRLMADVARNVQDAEASGVMAIPEARK